MLELSYHTKYTQEEAIAMDYPNNNTKHEKGKHLKNEDYVVIQVRLRDGWKANRIATELGCAANTVRNIIRKGMTPLYNGKVLRFQAQTAWAQYETNRQNSGRKIDALNKQKFLRYVEKQCHEAGWSMDACAGKAVRKGIFRREDTVCTKTLYNYIDLGLINVKNIDLPFRVSRKTKKKRICENKRVLGRSIEERPEEVESREEFGHWETDLVIGNKSGRDNVLLTLIERKTRDLFVVCLPDKSADSVLSVFERVKKELGDKFGKVFRTITTDNGSEFARLPELENASEIKIYFAHPYTSCEKGTIENHNSLIRRFIRKGKCISDYSNEDILRVEMWANGLPRKILGCRTPDEAFDDEMDLIYATV